eukprot:759734-Hanusia_phi.AAC.1
MFARLSLFERGEGRRRGKEEEMEGGGEGGRRRGRKGPARARTFARNMNSASVISLPGLGVGGTLSPRAPLIFRLETTGHVVHTVHHRFHPTPWSPYLLDREWGVKSRAGGEGWGREMYAPHAAAGNLSGGGDGDGGGGEVESLRVDDGLASGRSLHDGGGRHMCQGEASCHAGSFCDQRPANRVAGIDDEPKDMYSELKSTGESLVQRIDRMRKAGVFDLAFKYIHSERSSEEGREAAMGAQSLFGFARVPSMKDALAGIRSERKLEERRNAVCALRHDLLALGQVLDNLPHGLQVRLERVADWDGHEGRAIAARKIPENLGALDIRGLVPAEELYDGIKASEFNEVISNFRKGSHLLMVITKVESHYEHVVLSMRQSRINPQLSQTFVLGHFPEPWNLRSIWGHGEPPSTRNSDYENSDPSSSLAAGNNSEIFDLNDLLRKDPLFWNPYAVSHMAASFKIQPDARLFLDPFEKRETMSYSELRKKQNVSWANDSVRKGIHHAADRNYVMAIKCYQNALELDNENADAYVALGAAYANTSKSHEAIEAFTKALEIQPDHSNALKYLNATRSKFGLAVSPKPQDRKGADDRRGIPAERADLKRNRLSEMEMEGESSMSASLKRTYEKQDDSSDDSRSRMKRSRKGHKKSSKKDKKKKDKKTKDKVKKKKSKKKRDKSKKRKRRDSSSLDDDSSLSSASSNTSSDSGSETERSRKKSCPPAGDGKDVITAACSSQAQA